MQRVRAARLGVGLGRVGERKQVRHRLGPVLRVLAEALVELAADPARHVGDDPVEHLAALLVHEQVVVDHRAQEAPRLGAPVGVGVAQPAGRGVALGRRPVLQPRRGIAQGGHAEAHDGRADGRVHHAVETALLEPALEPHVGRVGRRAAVDDAGKAPACARDGNRLGVRLVAHRQHRVPLVEVGGGIRAVAAIGEQQVLGGRVALELGVETPAQGPAGRIHRVGRVEPQQTGEIGQITLPAAGDHDVPAAHEEAVAAVDRRIRI